MRRAVGNCARFARVNQPTTANGARHTSSGAISLDQVFPKRFTYSGTVG